MKENMISLIASTNAMKEVGSKYPTKKKDGGYYSSQISTYNQSLMEYEVLEYLLFH